MEVQFRRTGERQYGVTINRKDLPVVERNSAPGYDPLVPHDLMHLIVELELGLKNGIFGQVAKGGNAGSFQPVTAERKDDRQAKRRRKRAAKMLRQGLDDCIQSEHATYLCWYEWLARSKDPQRRKLANHMASHVQSFRVNLPRSEVKGLNEDVIKRVCERLEDVSARWSSLRVGESLTVEWPENSRAPSPPETNLTSDLL